LKQIEETRKKLQELEREFELCKLRKYHVVLEIETNPADWGCSGDEIIDLIKDYFDGSIVDIKDLIQLGDPDDKMTLKSAFEVKD
jgi:hypothetical protein